MTEITDLSTTDASNTAITGESLVGTVANMGRMENTLQAVLGLLARSIRSNVMRIVDNTDATKKIAFDAAGITTATTRTITMGDANVTLRPQAWELISNTTIAAASDWRAIDLSPFRDLRIRGYVLPATDGVELRMRTSSNNGSTFDAGANDYSWYRIYGLSDVAASDGDAADNEINIGGTSSVGGDVGEGIHFTIEAFNFNASLVARFLATANALNAAGAHVVTTTGGLRVSTTARNAISIYFSSGNIASGYIALEGIRA